MISKQNNMPRLVISSLSGGGGKTLISLGFIRSLIRQGVRVKPYKKGPDYIDSAWLSLAACNTTTNLDPFFLSKDKLISLFYEKFANAHIGIIEGNRGLYDGKDLEGSYSTSFLARTLNAPVIIVLDCTKMTRTAAALVAGLASFESIWLAGVILNQIGSSRHASIVRRSIEYYTDIPVLGEFPRFLENPVPERQMGLTSIYREQEVPEYPLIDDVLNCLADTFESSINIKELLSITVDIPTLVPQCSFWENDRHCTIHPKIGYVHDSALWFYYPENLEALERAGAEVVRLNLLDPQPWPKVDALYLGGGFPENLAELITHSPHLKDIKTFSGQGMPIYAECGGLIILSDSLEINGRTFPMAGIFPIKTALHVKPQGLGYVEAYVMKDTPFHTKGEVLRGHEFHYSSCRAIEELQYLFELKDGVGMGKELGQGVDGLLVQNTFASYTHLFAPAVPSWAERFVDAAGHYSQHS